MSYFVDHENRTPNELAPGVFLRTFWGEEMTVAVVDILPGAEVPMHDHVNEQIGLMVRGELSFTIGDETKTVYPGDVWVIPGWVKHGCTAGPDGAHLLEVFAPARDEYKFPQQTS